jgi:DNA-binding transcriptional MocR family regulator
MDRHLRRLRQAFHTQMSQISNAIMESFPSGTSISRPAGGFFLWVQLPKGVNALDLYRAADTDGIHIVPGQVFYPHTDGTNHIRLSCGYPFTDRMQQAIHTLGQGVKHRI